MGTQGGIVYRYSLVFKQKVVSEIESGKYTLEECRKIYDIRGTITIQGWLKKLGKQHLINRIVRIEMRDEKDKIKNLEFQKKQLESALAQTQLKVLALESLLNVAEEHYGIDIKKNFGGKPPIVSVDKARRLDLDGSAKSTDIADKRITNTNRFESEERKRKRL